MGLNTIYDSFVISLDSTPTTDLTFNYVVHCMLNEEVHQGNCKGTSVHLLTLPPLLSPISPTLSTPTPLCAYVHPLLPLYQYQ
jgi:hypothetical protein